MRPLIGMAVGDAWGVPFEMKKASDPLITGWDGKTLVKGSPFGDVPEGYYSDDTQMAVCLALSLVERQGYNQEAVAAEYLRWYRSGEARGMGGSVREAMQGLDRGEPVDRAGVPDAKGNGTAMRALPLGLYFRDLEKLAVVSKRDAVITHLRNEAIDGTYAVAALASLTITDKALVDNTLGQALTVRHVRQVAASLPMQTSLIRDALLRACYQTVGLDHPLTELKTMRVELEGGVVETIGTAVHAALVGRDYHHTLELCIRCGGDTDTRAAIACGLKAISHPIPDFLVAPVGELAEVARLERQLLDSRK